MGTGALTPSAPVVRFRSVAGVGLILLIIYGLINIGAAIGVPLSLEMKGGQGGGDGGVIIGRVPEEFMLGTTYTRLHTENPKLDQLLVDSMVGMCAMMMAMGVLYLAAAWFGARRGTRWVLWSLLVSGIVWVPYYFVIGADLARFGAPDAGKAPWMVAMFALPPILGVALMLAGTRRQAT
jgi:hypothetical protein